MALKMLHVTGSLRIGGLENVAMDCYRVARTMGYDVDFLVFGKTKEYYEDEVLQNGGNVFHIAAPSANYLKFYHEVQRIIRENGGYDIVHSHTFFNSGIVLKAAKACGVKRCIAHCHSSRRSGAERIDKKLYNDAMRRSILKNSDVYCACSSQAGEYFYGKDVYKQHGFTIPNKIDASHYRYSEESRRKIRAELNVPQNAVVIGTVGHLTAAKNQRLLIRLFSALYSDCMDYRLLIVGDGELRESLEQYAVESGIKEQVIFTGTRTDVDEVLSAMDVFVLTSKHEGFGIVLLESQANGLPTIGIEEVVAKEVRVSELLHLVKDGQSVEAWKDAISAALSNGRDYNEEAYSRISEMEKTFQDTVKNIYTVR